MRFEALDCFDITSVSYHYSEFWASASYHYGECWASGSYHYGECPGDFGAETTVCSGRALNMAVVVVGMPDAPLRTSFDF